MKKYWIISMILLCLWLMPPQKIEAANICTGSIYNNLKRDAYRVEVSWNLKFDEKHHHYFEVTVANMNENLLLMFGDTTYEATKDQSPFKINVPLEGGKTYDFKFYGGYSSPCVEEYVYTRSLEIPKYNTYSELEECIEFEEFPLCNKWYRGDIKDKEYFLEQLEIYKKSLEKPVEKEPPIEEKEWWQKAIEFYVDNLVITLPITIGIVLLIAVVIIIKVRKAKKRVKIDLNV